MNAVASSKTRDRNRAPVGKRHSGQLRQRHRGDVPIVEVDDELEQGAEVSALDVLGAEFCHQIVRDLADGGRSEAVEADGFDPSDWLQSEADGAHLLQSTSHR